MAFSDPANRPPPWVRRAVLSLLGGMAALWYLRGVISSLRSLFLILLVSLFLSFALEPAVNRLERLGLRRGARRWSSCWDSVPSAASESWSEPCWQSR